MQNNRLHGAYQQHQNNMYVPNNPLLASQYNQNNSNNLNNPNNQMARMQMMQVQQQMQKVKQMQQLKQIEKRNEIDQKYDLKKIKDLVITSEKIQKKNNVEIEKKLKEKQRDFLTERTKLWKARTNVPYKNILKSAKILKDDDYKKKFKDNKELIIHKVTDADKNVIALDNEFCKYKGNIETHNSELKSEYSLSKEAEHLKEFEYHHKYQFKLKFTPSDHNDLKIDNIEYYKNEQKKMEDGKQKLDDLIDSLVSHGLLPDEEIKKLENNETVDIDLSKVDLNGKTELEEQYEKIKEGLKADGMADGTISLTIEKRNISPTLSDKIDNQVVPEINKKVPVVTTVTPSSVKIINKNVVKKQIGKVIEPVKPTSNIGIAKKGIKSIKITKS